MTDGPCAGQATLRAHRAEDATRAGPHAVAWGPARSRDGRSSADGSTQRTVMVAEVVDDSTVAEPLYDTLTECEPAVVPAGMRTVTSCEPLRGT